MGINDNRDVGRGGPDINFEPAFDTILYDFSSESDPADCDELKGGLDGRDELAYAGDIVSEFLVSAVGDENQANAQIIGACEWEDLRSSPLAKLPHPAFGHVRRS